MINKHGGDVYGLDIRIDFSANLNPLGMPGSVEKAALKAVSESAGYPDPYCRELTKKLSEHEGVSVDKIVCGNGADDLIFRIIHALEPKRAALLKPTFSEYAKALREFGCAVSEYTVDSISDGLSDDIDIIILCNPNNPTGQFLDTVHLKIICEKCAENGTILLCDECFIDLCESPEMRSVKQFLNENVIVLKAFTKTYAIAGLRLGYALFGSTHLAAKVRESGQFWSVSTVAQAAGKAALDERNYIENARKIIANERKFLSEELQKFGFTVYPSVANFILFRCGYPLDEMLLNEGIMIRNCADFSGLEDGYFRIAVRLHEENEMLIDAIKKVIKWQKT